MAENVSERRQKVPDKNIQIFPARIMEYGKFRISELITVGFFRLYTRLKFFNRANLFQSGKNHPHQQNDVPV